MLDVVEEVVGFSVVGRSPETLKKYFKPRPNDALSHIKGIQGPQKEVSSHHLKASCHTIIDSFILLVKNLAELPPYKLFLSISLIELCIIICTFIFIKCYVLHFWKLEVSFL